MKPNILRTARLLDSEGDIIERKRLPGASKKMLEGNLPTAEDAKNLREKRNLI